VHRLIAVCPFRQGRTDTALQLFLPSIVRPNSVPLAAGPNQSTHRAFPESYLQGGSHVSVSISWKHTDEITGISLVKTQLGLGGSTGTAARQSSATRVSDSFNGTWVLYISCWRNMEHVWSIWIEGLCCTGFLSAVQFACSLLSAGFQSCKLPAPVQTLRESHLVHRLG